MNLSVKENLEFMAGVYQIKNPKEKIDELSKKDYSPENIVATDNFYAGKNGITWLYNPYDIAPYYLGQTRITLPYSVLRPYLLPECPVKRIFE